jgi:hypothetical protein
MISRARTLMVPDPTGADLMSICDFLWAAIVECWREEGPPDGIRSLGRVGR